MIRRPPGARPIVATLLLLLTCLSATAKELAPLATRLPKAVADAQRLVEKVRGIPFKGTVSSALLPEAELGKMLEKKIAEDLPAPFPLYQKTLEAVGLIEPVPDLEKKIVNLYTRQVAGFYDPSERKFYIVPERSGATDDETSGTMGLSVGSLMEETLLSHELTHALQDRRLGLDKRMKSLKDDTDAALALQAVLEGEATVVMTEALVSRLPEEARGLMGDSLTHMMAGLNSTPEKVEGSEGVPDFFIKELLFPYSGGASWIQFKRKVAPKHDWSAIDQTYKNLPTTTSEILHPNKTFAGRLRLSASARNLAPDLPNGAKVIYADTLGEWVIRTLLEKTSFPDEAFNAAVERHDDRILFFQDAEERVGFLWRLRCASPAGAQKMAAELKLAYNGRTGAARPTIAVTNDTVDVRLGVPAP